jgi:hypothetical protein
MTNINLLVAQQLIAKYHYIKIVELAFEHNHKAIDFRTLHPSTRPINGSFLFIDIVGKIQFFVDSNGVYGERSFAYTIEV